MHHRFVIGVLCLSIGLAAKPSEAQAVPSGTQAAGIFAVILGIGAVAGIGTYYLLHKTPPITGCVVSNAGGMTLTSETDQQTYMLLGAGPEVKAGDRVQVKGKRQKKNAAGLRPFVVEELAKDYGPCRSVPVAP